jgi:hypothetical protein
MADVAGDLRKAKESCEAKARSAKQQWPKGLPNDPKAIEEGRDRYGLAKAEFDGCITAIKAGFETGFPDEDVKKLKTRLEAAHDAAERFAEWYARMRTASNQQAGAGPPLPSLKDLLPLLDTFAKEAAKRSAEEKANLRALFEESRFTPWEKLGPDGGALPAK